MNNKQINTPSIPKSVALQKAVDELEARLHKKEALFQEMLCRATNAEEKNALMEKELEVKQTQIEELQEVIIKNNTQITLLQKQFGEQCKKVTEVKHEKQLVLSKQSAYKEAMLDIVTEILKTM